MHQDQIISAIKNLKVVKILYGGSRIIEPHILYESPSGNTLLDAYQTSGYSESNKPADWKRFVIDKIQSFELTENAFSPHEGYNSDNRERYPEVIAKV